MLVHLRDGADLCRHFVVAVCCLTSQQHANVSQGRICADILLLLFVACLTSQQHANVSQGRICADILLLLFVLWGSPSSSAFPARSLGFTFFFCVPSYMYGVPHSYSSSAFLAICTGFPILILLLRSQLYVPGFPILILLLRSQLDLWGSPSSASPARSLGFTFFSCVTSYISGVHLFLLRPQLDLWGSPFWKRFFCVCDRFFFFFFNSTIEVVTFRLSGWCILCVLLLPAITRLGHERQDLYDSLRWHACVHWLDLSFIPERVVGKWSRNRC